MAKIIEERSCRTGDFGAALALGLETMFADQRADPQDLLLDRIKRFDAGDLGVELGSGVTIELCQRML